jgi:hypothetical protein
MAGLFQTGEAAMTHSVETVGGGKEVLLQLIMTS